MNDEKHGVAAMLPADGDPLTDATERHLFECVNPVGCVNPAQLGKP